MLSRCVFGSVKFEKHDCTILDRRLLVLFFNFRVRNKDSIVLNVSDMASMASQHLLAIRVWMSDKRKQRLKLTAHRLLNSSESVTALASQYVRMYDYVSICTGNLRKMHWQGFCSKSNWTTELALAKQIPVWSMPSCTFFKHAVSMYTP